MDDSDTDEEKKSTRGGGRGRGRIEKMNNWNYGRCMDDMRGRGGGGGGGGRGARERGTREMGEQRGGEERYQGGGRGERGARQDNAEHINKQKCPTRDEDQQNNREQPTRNIENTLLHTMKEIGSQIQQLCNSVAQLTKAQEEIKSTQTTIQNEQVQHSKAQTQMQTTLDKHTQKHSKLADSVEKIESKIETIESNQNFCKEAIQELNKQIKNTDKTVKHNRQTLKEMEDKQSNTESLVKQLGENVDRLEGYSKRNNLLFHGIQEKVGWEGREDCQEIIWDILQEFMPGEGWAVDLIERAHRLGRYMGGMRRPRPIIIRVLRWGDAMRILGNREGRARMKRFGLHISQDTTTKQKAELRKLREQGRSGYIYRGKVYEREERTEQRREQRTTQTTQRGMRVDRGSVAGREDRGEEIDRTGERKGENGGGRYSGTRSYSGEERRWGWGWGSGGGSSPIRERRGNDGSWSRPLLIPPRRENRSERNQTEWERKEEEANESRRCERREKGYLDQPIEREDKNKGTRTEEAANRFQKGPNRYQGFNEEWVKENPGEFVSQLEKQMALLRDRLNGNKAITEEEIDKIWNEAREKKIEEGGGMNGREYGKERKRVETNERMNANKARANLMEERNGMNDQGEVRSEREGTREYKDMREEENEPDLNDGREEVEEEVQCTGTAIGGLYAMEIQLQNSCQPQTGTQVEEVSEEEREIEEEEEESERGGEREREGNDKEITMEEGREEGREEEIEIEGTEIMNMGEEFYEREEDTGTRLEAIGNQTGTKGTTQEQDEREKDQKEEDKEDERVNKEKEKLTQTRANSGKKEETNKGRGIGEEGQMTNGKGNEDQGERREGGRGGGIINEQSHLKKDGPKEKRPTTSNFGHRPLSRRSSSNLGQTTLDRHVRGGGNIGGMGGVKNNSAEGEEGGGRGRDSGIYRRRENKEGGGEGLRKGLRSQSQQKKPPYK